MLLLTTTTRATSSEVRRTPLDPRISALSHPFLTSLVPVSLALGQLMLFVDGMLGVVAHSETVQWLYTLCASPVSDPQNNVHPFPATRQTSVYSSVKRVGMECLLPLRLHITGREPGYSCLDSALFKSSPWSLSVPLPLGAAQG